MDVFEIVRTLRRQFKLVIALGALCLLIGGFAFSQIGSSYVATADLQILPNNGANTENPLDKLNRNQTTVAEMIAARLSSGAIRDEIDDAGLISTYTAEALADPSGNSSLPTVTLRVSGPKTGAVENTKKALVTRVQAELEDLQTEIGAPKASWLQAQVLTQTDEPFLETASRFKSLLILLVVSGAFIISTTLVVDGIRRDKNEYDEPITVSDVPKKSPVRTTSTRKTKGETIRISASKSGTPDEKSRDTRVK